MFRYLWWVPVMAVLAVSSSRGEPVKGAHAQFKARVNAQSDLVFEEKFVAGKRACVIAVGDHKPVVDIGVTVFDDANRIVAEDQGGGDFVAAIWYPPREAKYKIVVKNTGLEYNEMYLVFK